MPADIYDSKGRKIGSVEERVPASATPILTTLGCIAAPFALALILFVGQYIFPTVVPVVTGLQKMRTWNIPKDIVFCPFSFVISENMYLPLIAIAFLFILTRRRIPVSLRFVFAYIFFLAITYCAEAVDFMWTDQMKQQLRPVIWSIMENQWIDILDHQSGLMSVETGIWYISSFCVGGLYFVVSIVLTTIINLRRKRTDDFVVE